MRKNRTILLSAVSIVVMLLAVMSIVTAIAQWDRPPASSIFYINTTGNLSSCNCTWAQIQFKPTLFPTSWSNITFKPTLFPTSWSNITGAPQINNTNSGSTNKTSSIESWLGHQFVDGREDETYDVNHISNGFTASVFSVNKTYQFDFAKNRMNSSNGYWIADFMCINYGGYPPNEWGWLDIASGVPFRKLKNATKFELSLRVKVQDCNTIFSICRDFTSTSWGMMGNITLGVNGIDSISILGNTTYQTFDVRNNLSLNNWTTLSFAGTLPSVPENEDGQNMRAWFVLRQNQDITNCPPIGFAGSAIGWYVESLSLRQFRE